MILSTTVGIPRFRTPPFGFGISTLSTGCGLYFLFRIFVLISIQFSLRYLLTSSILIPSMPPAPLLAFTFWYAIFMFSLDNI